MKGKGKKGENRPGEKCEFYNKKKKNLWRKKQTFVGQKKEMR